VCVTWFNFKELDIALREFVCFEFHIKKRTPSFMYVIRIINNMKGIYYTHSFYFCSDVK